MSTNVNPETGEVHEHWVPESLDDAEKVLRRMFDRECNIRALRERLKLFTENIEAMIAHEERELKSLEWRYGPALEAIARRELEQGKKKAKHLKTPFGRFGFRKAPDKTELTVPQEEALAWAKKHAPQIVIVTERVNKTDLAEVGAPFIQRIEGEEVFYINLAPPKKEDDE